MRKMFKAKALAFMLVSALVLPLLPVFSLNALAADHTYYIDYGNITVAKNAGDASLLDVTYYAFSGASSTTTDTVAAADEIVIAQTSGSTVSVIVVASGEVHMTLDSVKIRNLYSTPFTISPGATVHLTISGACILDTGGASAYICGMNVPSGAAVVIDKQTSDTSDSLYVDSGSACAGIGGSDGQSCGSVTINGGTLNVNGSGAGIGGGASGSGGSVTINGGTVNANSNSGAGIGGGIDGSGGTVTINGGTVTAKSFSGGAGIGGGNGGNGGSVTITGGTVIATGSLDDLSRKFAANIGGGANAATPGTLVIDIPEPDAVIDAGYGGSITGSGPYSITASIGYVIDSLKVDGTIVPDATGQASYEIISVSKSLIVTFAYTANFLEPANGSLTVASAGETITSGQIVRGGQQLAITAEPDAGYVLESLTVNGEDVTGDYVQGYTYTVGTQGDYRALGANKDTGIQGAQIAASFVLASSQDASLISITPPDAITGIINGTEKTAAALGLPATVALVTDHGDAQASVSWDVAASTYDPNNPAAQNFAVNGEITLPVGIQNPNHVSLNISISVSVDPKLYTITATAGPGGSITPSGPTSVAAGSSQAFTIKPDTGYTISSVTVDSVEQVPVSTYTFTGIGTDHTIQAAFALANTNDFAFGTREKEVSSILISAEGLFKTDAVLNATPLAGGEGSRAALEALLSGKETVAAFDVSIAPGDAFLPPLTLRFHVGEAYNGRTVYILHRLHDNSVEQFTPTIADGVATITVMELSPFVILADPWVIITSQPQNITVPKGQTATFTVFAEGELPLTYQWQKKTGSNAAWADIPGAVNPEYTTSSATLANSGFQYRVIITDTLHHSAVSAAATLMVVKSPDTGDHAQPMLYGALMALFLTLGMLLISKKKAR